MSKEPPLRAEQPTAGEFTKRIRTQPYDPKWEHTLIIRTEDRDELCDRLDRAEAENKRVNAGWATESQLRENLLQENYKYEMKIKELEAAIAKAKK